ncbi:MAG: hypothetical protein ACIALR_06480, partial [Blastopirellula sp. JB062]
DPIARTDPAMVTDPIARTDLAMVTGPSARTVLAMVTDLVALVIQIIDQVMEGIGTIGTNGVITFAIAMITGEAATIGIMDFGDGTILATTVGVFTAIVPILVIGGAGRLRSV